MSPSCDYALDSGGSSLMLSVSSRHQVLGDAKRGVHSKKKKTTSAGFEPTPPTEKWFRVTRLRPLGQDVISVIYFFMFFMLMSKCQLTACQPHSLRRERWGLSRCGLKPGHVEWGWKEREREGGFWLVDGVEVSVMACFINSCQCQLMHLSLVIEGQSRVYHTWCILATLPSVYSCHCFYLQVH